MKTKVKPIEQSIEALMHQIDSGQMKKDSAKILDFIINNGPITQLDVINMKGIHFKSVTARLSDLMNLGIIEAIGKTDPQMDPGSKRKISYTLYMYQPDPQKQLKNAYTRKLEGFEKLKRQMTNKYSDLLDIKVLDSLQLKIWTDGE